MAQKQVTSMRLSEEARRLLQVFSEWYGISHTAVIELAIREKAQHEKLPLHPKNNERREAPSTS